MFERWGGGGGGGYLAQWLTRKIKKWHVMPKKVAETETMKTEKQINFMKF